jgi:hypothetical protein
MVQCAGKYCVSYAPEMNHVRNVPDPDCLPKPLIVMATIVDQNRLFEVKLSHRECFLQKKFLGLRPIYSMAEPQVPPRACFTLYRGAKNVHFGALIYSIAELVPR